jgi:sugar O-acyltransferase (sialic acid O-acetyltransferase NeuD family)
LPRRDGTEAVEQTELTAKYGGIVVIGAGEQAEIAYEYFTRDSPETVVGFAVEAEYLDKSELCGLPVVALEEIQERFPAERHSAFVALSSTKLNRLRTRLYEQVKGLGYGFATYVSSRAFVWHNVEVGENCMIFENNVLQHRVEVGDNVVLWSGNHVGHRTRIEDHCFIASHVVISGYCEVGRSSFMGVNSCANDFIKIAEDCVIGSGAVVVKDTEPGKVYVGNPARPLDRTSYESFGVDE